jgi:hypothetical protein
VYDFESIERHPNDVWFVSSTSAFAVDDTGHGRDPDAPYATLNYAATVRAANLGPQANVGDVIYLMPGHVEIATAVAPVTIAVAGVTIRGLGHGANRAMVRFDTAIGADINVNAANVTFENVDFVVNFADVTAAVDVNACDATFIGCRFLAAGANLNALIWIQDAAANQSDRITVDHCYLNDVDAANTHFINFAGTGDGHRIIDNVLIGDFGTMCIGGAGIVTHAVVSRNEIFNQSNVADSCIAFAGTATGLMCDNRAGGVAAQAQGFVGDYFAKCNNLYVDLDEDASALLDPVGT